jgi:hypothetical protein
MIRTVLLGALIACGSPKPAAAPPAAASRPVETESGKDTKPEKQRRMKGAKLRQECIDNPLAKGCDGEAPPCDKPPCATPDSEDPCGGGE